MPFQLETVTQVTITNANPRRELHGEEKVRAIDLSFMLKGENTLLDLIEPGLREHHFCNRALKAGQVALPGVVVPMPNVKFPHLPNAYNYAKGQKWRGYRFIWDYGTRAAHVDFTDVVLSGLSYEYLEGGSCTIYGTIQYNGEELQDNDVYGELSGLASDGDIHILLLAPAELVQAKKGYRAGRIDTPQTQVQDGQQELGDGAGDPEVDDDDGTGEPLTPETALAGSLKH